MIRLPKLITRPRTAALGCGLASATGFAPLGAWPVALLAYVGLIYLIAHSGRRRAFAVGWWFGLGQFALGLNWIAHAFDFQDAMPHAFGYLAVVLLSGYLAVYPATAALLAAVATRAPAKQAKPWALVLTFAAAWIITEYLRATLFTGFAWNPLGVIWVGTPVAAIAAFIGTYALSGLTVLAAGALVPLARHLALELHRKPLTPRRVAAVVAIFVLPELLAIVVLPILLGSTPLAVRSAGFAIRVVQPNISQAQRHDRDFDEQSVQRLEALTGPSGATPRLVLWPEAAVPYYLEEEPWARGRVAQLLGPRDLLLTGGTKLNYDARGALVSATNSLFVVDAAARLIGRYDKAHLVPYGEYLPMRPILSAIGLSQLVQSDVDFVPGPAPETLPLPGFGRVGVQICYEIIFSGQVTDRARRPDFIFNPSTDAWFGAWGPPQHLAQARLRAIEEALPIVRATPTGISAVIDAQGRLQAALPLNKAGFLVTRLPPAAASTLFARHGNAVALAVAIVLALAGVALVRRSV